MNGVSVYLGSQRGKESLIERMLFAYAFFVLKQEWYTFCSANIWNYSSTWGTNYKIMPLARSLDGGPLPPSVYLGRHWRHSHDKCSQAFPLHFCTLQAIKNWTVGRPGNEATRYILQATVFLNTFRSQHVRRSDFLLYILRSYLHPQNTTHTNKYLGISECMKAMYLVWAHERCSFAHNSGYGINLYANVISHMCKTS